LPFKEPLKLSHRIVDTDRKKNQESLRIEFIQRANQRMIKIEEIVVHETKL